MEALALNGILLAFGVIPGLVHALIIACSPPTPAEVSKQERPAIAATSRDPRVGVPGPKMPVPPQSPRSNGPAPFPSGPAPHTDGQRPVRPPKEREDNIPEEPSFDTDALKRALTV